MIHLERSRLKRAVRQKKRDEGRAAYDSLGRHGLHPNDLRRLELGEPLYAQVFAQICAWLGRPMEDFLSNGKG